jgi:dienelactone hydrolase
MADQYQHLGIYSDWVAEAHRQHPLYPSAAPGPETQQRLRESLGFTSQPEVAQDLRSEGIWERDGLQGEELSWWAGYGPRTHARVLKPAGVQGPLPGMLALHDHGGFKFYGKEKISTGQTDPPDVLVDYQKRYYGGRAYANALAREGFVVLIHDAFLWGSRRFPLDSMPGDLLAEVRAARSVWRSSEEMPATPDEIAEYNAMAEQHEHVIEKYCNLLGTTMAGVVSHEDRIAFNYLLSRPDVKAGQAGCLGLSGGGNRTALMQATHDQVQAAVVVGMMSTYSGALDHNVFTHTWMWFPHGLARWCDWPDITACRAPSPLMVQYDLQDDLFTEQGMRDAHAKISLHYQDSGHPEAYTGQFYPGVHKFDLPMQQAAFAWLKEKLR